MGIAEKILRHRFAPYSPTSKDMRKLLIFFWLAIHTNIIHTQSLDTIMAPQQNIADQLMGSDGRLLLGGYGEVHYNQPLQTEKKDNGTLDVHRMVVLLGYNFSNKVQFISEIEFEHVSEVYIEQAFLQYKLNKFLNFRAGLMLIPMGIINEFHEPTSFNGVERPVIDTRISPTTWREIGIGISGNILQASLKYQLYLVIGFNGYDGEGNLNGKNGLRNGRQKGAESYISAPNFAGRIEYYGLKGLNLGLSGYFGNTQSTLYQGIDKDDRAALSTADSSVTGLIMAGLDARYTTGGLQLRGQSYYVSLSNTLQYNAFTAVNGLPNDLGSAMYGYYLEAGYDLLHANKRTEMEWIIFTRFEQYDTHLSTAGELVRNETYNNHVITGGFTLRLVKGAVVKADIQLARSAAASVYSKTFNAGIGIMF